MSEDLPRANVRRIVKGKMMVKAASRFRNDRMSRDLPVHKDALMAFSESAKIFIHYLSATANDICRESNRQTINAEDVLRAVEEIEFMELIKPLRGALESYRKASESKKAKKRKEAVSSGKKSRLEKQVASHEYENGEVDIKGEQDEGSNMEEEDEEEEEDDDE